MLVDFRHQRAPNFHLGGKKKRSFHILITHTTAELTGRWLCNNADIRPLLSLASTLLYNLQSLRCATCNLCSAICKSLRSMHHSTVHSDRRVQDSLCLSAYRHSVLDSSAFCTSQINSTSKHGTHLKGQRQAHRRQQQQRRHHNSPRQQGCIWTQPAWSRQPHWYNSIKCYSRKHTAQLYRQPSGGQE